MRVRETVGPHEVLRTTIKIRSRNCVDMALFRHQNDTPDNCKLRKKTGTTEEEMGRRRYQKVDRNETCKLKGQWRAG